jgi:hypothetical protein
MRVVHESWERGRARVAGLAVASVALLAAAQPVVAAARSGEPIARSTRAGSLVRDTRAQRDPLEWLRAFTVRVARGQTAIDAVSIGPLGEVIADLRLVWRLEPERGREVAAALLDLLGVTLALYSPAADERLTPPVQDARATLAQALEERFDGDFGLFLTRDVLARAQSHPLERRRAAAWLYTRRKVPGSELALLTAARDPDAPLRAIALEALVGCPACASRRARRRASRSRSSCAAISSTRAGARRRRRSR